MRAATAIPHRAQNATAYACAYAPRGSDVGRDTPSYTVLGYGKTLRFHGFTCTSRVTGLTCTNPAGHGLFLSRASYRLW